MLIAIVIAAVLAFNFVFFLSLAVSSSRRDDFDREQEDGEQMKAIEDYMRRKTLKKQEREERRKLQENGGEK